MKYITHQSSKNGILCIKRAKNLLSEEGTKKFWIGGTCLDWGGRSVPLDGSGPPIHTHPDIGQPWSNSLIDSRIFGQVGGSHRSFRQCPVVQFSQLPPINGEGGGS